MRTTYSITKKETKPDANTSLTNELPLENEFLYQVIKFGESMKVKPEHNEKLCLGFLASPTNETSAHSFIDYMYQVAIECNPSTKKIPTSGTETSSKIDVMGILNNEENTSVEVRITTTNKEHLAALLEFVTRNRWSDERLLRN